MTRKNKTILNYCVLILLAAAVIVCGRFINSKRDSSPEEDYAKKLAELRADLAKAAITGDQKKHTSGNIKRQSTGKSPKAHST
jgi:hypothetical protein